MEKREEEESRSPRSWSNGIPLISRKNKQRKQLDSKLMWKRFEERQTRKAILTIVFEDR